ncbi:MAG TPA: substrate-binding domain-containing protein [Caulifigura sp.]|nr:substrate-binding domain-containing protein [Caulifigura sp.]
MTTSHRSENRVRELRIARRLTQAELAGQAGISRPAVTAIEAGRIAPSVTAAISIAKVLDTTVETLFAADEQTPFWAWRPPREVWRAWRAEIAGAPLLIPVEATASATAPHDIVATETGDPDFDWRTARSTLVVASCDPAANQMAAQYQALTGHRMIVVRRSSRQALELLRQGKVHVAGMHLATHGRGRSNAQVAREVLGAGFQILRAASWKSGIATDQRLEGLGLKRLVKDKVRWVGREEGSGARQCLDDVLGRDKQYRHIARDHAGVVEAIRGGWADAGVCVELASVEAGLPFTSVRTEDYDICFSASATEDPRIRGLIDLLRNRRYRQLLGEIPGYSSDETGAGESI